MIKNTLAVLFTTAIFTLISGLGLYAVSQLAYWATRGFSWSDKNSSHEVITTMLEHSSFMPVLAIAALACGLSIALLSRKKANPA